MTWHLYTYINLEIQNRYGHNCSVYKSYLNNHIWQIRNQCWYFKFYSKIISTGAQWRSLESWPSWRQIKQEIMPRATGQAPYSVLFNNSYGTDWVWRRKELYIPSTFTNKLYWGRVSSEIDDICYFRWP